MSTASSYKEVKKTSFNANTATIQYEERDRMGYLLQQGLKEQAKVSLEYRPLKNIWADRYVISYYTQYPDHIDKNKISDSLYIENLNIVDEDSISVIQMEATQFVINGTEYKYLPAGEKIQTQYRIQDYGGLGSYTDKAGQTTQYAFYVGNIASAKDLRAGSLPLEPMEFTYTFPFDVGGAKQTTFYKMIMDKGGEDDIIHICGIAPESVKVLIRGNDLLLSIEQGTFLIKNQLANNGQQIEKLRITYSFDYDLVEIAKAAKKYDEANLRKLDEIIKAEKKKLTETVKVVEEKTNSLSSNWFNQVPDWLIKVPGWLPGLLPQAANFFIQTSDSLIQVMSSMTNASNSNSQSITSSPTQQALQFTTAF